MRSAHVEIDGARLHWREAGAGEAVVLLHAFPLHSGMWAQQLASLPPTRRWIAPDVRGFGRSESGRAQLTMDRIADDVAALLSHLGHERAALCGVSMGGYAALAFAHRHRDRLAALVLCDTRAGADDPAGKLARRVSSEQVRAEGPAAVAALMLDRLLGSTTRTQRPAIAARLREMLEEVEPSSFARGQAAMAARHDSTALLATLDLPALVAVGAEDAIIRVEDARAFAGALPRGELVVFDAAGHLPSLERPDAFDRALLDFLDRAGI